MFKKIFLFSMMAILLHSCHSKPTNAEINGNMVLDSLSEDTIQRTDKQVDAKVFKDAKTAEISTPTVHDVTGFYKVIPDKYLPVSGKPETALKKSDSKQQYLYLEYNEKLHTAIRLFKDKETGREYLFIATHDMIKNTGKYYALYLKAKHCIDVTAEIVPSLPDGVIKESYQKSGLKTTLKPAWFLDISSSESALYVYNSLDSSKFKNILTLPWKGGRFNY